MCERFALHAARKANSSGEMLHVACERAVLLTVMTKRFELQLLVLSRLFFCQSLAFDFKFHSLLFHISFLMQLQGVIAIDGNSDGLPVKTIHYLLFDHFL